jgi:hypothetical protein
MARLARTVGTTAVDEVPCRRKRAETGPAEQHRTDPLDPFPKKRHPARFLPSTIVYPTSESWAVHIMLIVKKLLM